MAHSTHSALEKLRQTHGKSQSTRGRKEKVRQKKVRFLIVCEGKKTEKLYFEALVDGMMSSVCEVNVAGTGKGTSVLITKTTAIKADLERKNDMHFDRVWVVFDKDDFKDFNEAIKEAGDKGFDCAWSNEAFKLWYCLHFEYLNVGISRAAYITKLESHLRKALGNKNYKYDKASPNTYRLLKEHGDEDKAKQRAEKLRKNYNGTNYATHNPCTMVDKLVDELQHPEQVFKLTP